MYAKSLGCMGIEFPQQMFPIAVLILVACCTNLALIYMGFEGAIGTILTIEYVSEKNFTPSS